MRSSGSGLNTGRVEARQCYQAFTAMGIAYGPGQQGIETLYTGEGQVLARLVLPPLVAETRDRFVLHPSMMDSALQASVGLILGPGQDLTSNPDRRSPASGPVSGYETMLPYALDLLEVRGGCSPSMWAWVRLSKGSAPGDRVMRLSIDICDEAGHICVVMRGFSLRSTERGTEKKAAKIERILSRQLEETCRRGEIRREPGGIVPAAYCSHWTR